MKLTSVTGWIDNGSERFYGVISIDGKGMISAIKRVTSKDGMSAPAGEPIITAGDFNAHSHPEQSIYTDFVDKTWDLGTWCRSTIYKYSILLTPLQVRLACRRAFARMALFGITSVMVSFYMHHNAANEYDREVIAAARDVGMRLIFGRMNYDIINADAYQGKRDSQKSYYETISQAECNFRELLSEDSETVWVCPALHSLHASTPQAIAAGIKLGCETKRPVQLHLSEDQGDVALSVKDNGLRPLLFLQRLLDTGAVPSLSCLTVSDCCWIDEAEREVIAANGIKVVLNARMNNRVKAGFPDLPAMLEKGIIPWLGTDGEASNDDLSVNGEREFLKRRYHGVIDPRVIDGLGRRPYPFRDSCLGAIAEGACADLTIRQNGKLNTVLVGGEPIVSNGKLAKLDIESDIEAPLREEVAHLRG